jgi:small-conductance mechanosensitive channel
MLGASAETSAAPPVHTRAGRMTVGGPVRASAAPGGASPAVSAASIPPSLKPQQVLAYVRQTLGWYRRMQSLQSRPRLAQDAGARARLQAIALESIRLSFEFGHAAAAALPSAATSAAAGSAVRPAAQLDEAVARIDARIQAFKSQLAAIDTRVSRAPARTRKLLRAQREALAASIELEQQVRSSVRTLQSFQSTTLAPQESGARGLEGLLENLERSVPEALAASALPAREVALRTSIGAESAAPAAPRGRAQAAAPVPFQPESAGIITLLGEWIALKGDSGRLSDAMAATRALRSRLDALQAPLRSAARELVRTEVDRLGALQVPQLQAARRSLDAAALRFKQLAALLEPLGEQRLALADAQGVITHWTDAIGASRATIARYLLTQVGFLAAWIVLVLVISEIWRRGLFRYLRDPRRRSHFQTLRRVTIGVALALGLVIGLVSEIGSLATYAGFLTAGLAVALQNVILAVVAYFLLIGRYGVRIGDRITLAGVTGRVAQIGLIRLYLLELGGQELRTTGRLVVLSNAVLFQPQAMFKQIPGADYLWHGISLTLAASADVQPAQQRLRAAVDAVYEKYRPQIEKKHAAEKALVDFDTAMPWPELRARYAQQGLRFEIRYPVEPDQAVLVDRELLDALKDALEAVPPLPVAASGDPALDASVG